VRQLLGVGARAALVAEDLDHADHGAQQAHQRRHRGNRAQRVQVALQLVRHGAAGFFHHVLGGVARRLRLQHHMAQAGGQHAAERRILFEIVDDLGRGLALLGGGERLLVQLRRQDLAALERNETFDDQRERDDRGEQQRPDRPAGRLNDGKHVDPRNSTKATDPKWSGLERQLRGSL